jgi:hypothetical protein
VALCPRREGGSECGGSKLASQMEAAEEGKGGGVLFIEQGGTEGRGLGGD